MRWIRRQTCELLKKTIVTTQASCSFSFFDVFILITTFEVYYSCVVVIVHPMQLCSSACFLSISILNEFEHHMEKNWLAL